MGSSFWPTWDTLVLAVPLLAILALGMFGLDERFVNHGTRRHSRSFCEIEGDGRFFSDPDGRPWRKYPERQIEARIIHSPSSDRLESRLNRRRQSS